MLERGRTAAFQVPPKVWIEERLARIQDVLQRKWGIRLALVLSTCCGPSDRAAIRPVGDGSPIRFYRMLRGFWATQKSDSWGKTVSATQRRPRPGLWLNSLYPNIV